MSLRERLRGLRQRWRRFRLTRAYETIVRYKTGKSVGFTPVMATWARMERDGWVQVADGDVHWNRSVFPGVVTHLPSEVKAAHPERIDYRALAREIGTPASAYELPTTPDGDDGPWLDRLAIVQDAAMYARDGGAIDTDRVLDGREVDA